MRNSDSRSVGFDAKQTKTKTPSQLSLLFPLSVVCLSDVSLYYTCEEANERGERLEELRVVLEPPMEIDHPL